MKNRLFLIALAAALGASLVPLAHATVIYSTFGPGNTFNTNDFVRIGPSGLPPAVNTGAYADEFTSPVNANVGSVSLALDTALAIPAAVGLNEFVVAIHSNSPTGPGGILGTFTSPIIPAGLGIFTFTSSTDIHLIAGTDYWLSLASPTFGGAADWFLNNQGIDNDIASRKNGVWTVAGPSTALAFSINTVPEPGSTTLCATALATTYLWRKRSVSNKS